MVGVDHNGDGLRAPTASWYAYRYDVDRLGKGRLLSVTPCTATKLSARKPTTVRLGLEPIAWTVPARDHIAVVIDTVDPRYASTAKAGTTLTSASAGPATLELPTGG